MQNTQSVKPGRQRYQRGGLKVEVSKGVQYWEARWKVYVMVDGVEKRRDRTKLIGTVARMTKGEAQAELDRLILGIPANDCAQSLPAPVVLNPVQPANPGDMTMGEYCDRYFEMMESSWAPSTQASNRSLFKHHIHPQLGHIPLRALTRELLQKHLDETGKTFRYSTVHQTKAALNAMLAEAEEAGLIARNPAGRLRIPKGLWSAVRRPFATPETLRRYLTAAEGPHKVVALIAMIDGLRPSEIFALRANDVLSGQLRIDESRVCKILRPGGKTNASKAPVRLPPMLEQILREHIQESKLGPNDFLFTDAKGHPVNQNSYVNHQMKTICKEAGIEPALNFRMLRRSFATYLAAHGSAKDLQGALRHESPEFSMRVYAQIVPAGTATAVDGWAGQLLEASPE